MCLRWYVGYPFPNEVFPKYCGYGVSYGGGSSFLGGFLVNDQVTLGEYTVSSTVIAMVGVQSSTPL
jgi:hypothetical protein